MNFAKCSEDMRSGGWRQGNLPRSAEEGLFETLPCGLRPNRAGVKAAQVRASLVMLAWWEPSIAGPVKSTFCPFGFEIGFYYVAQARLELTRQPRLASNS